MDEGTARFLLCDDGRTLLDAVSEETDALRALELLRRQVTATIAAAAWEVTEARRRGTVKFGADAANMYFTTESLEQASSAAAAAYHASRMVWAGVRRMVDLTGGIGADSLAFARAGLQVQLIEIDPVRALFAAENCRVAALQERVSVRCGDARGAVSDLAHSGMSDDMGAWLDPSRRAGGRRLHDPQDYSPPLSIVDSLRETGCTTIGVKLSPALDHAVGHCYSGAIEFLSDGGECKEAILWAGNAARTANGDSESVRATLLTRDGVHSLSDLDESTAAEPHGGVTPPGLGTPESLDPYVDGNLAMPSGVGYLYEPDPAVIRAHLVAMLGSRLHALPVDPNIAYLIGARLVSTPFARAYRILDQFPYHLRTLQRALRERGIGRVVVKKRGFPLEPDDVRKQLKLTGTGELTVVLTRVGLRHVAFLCEPVGDLRQR